MPFGGMLSAGVLKQSVVLYLLPSTGQIVALDHPVGEIPGQIVHINLHRHRMFRPEILYVASEISNADAIVDGQRSREDEGIEEGVES